MSNNGRARIDDDAPQSSGAFFVLESWLQLEPFLRAFTPKATEGSLLFRAESESDFVWSQRWTPFAEVHKKGLQRVCRSMSTFYKSTLQM